MFTPNKVFFTTFACFLGIAKALPYENIVSGPAHKSSSKISRKPSTLFKPLASVLFQRMIESSPEEIQGGSKATSEKTKEVDKISKALQSLSASQTTLKRLDGVAHEAYQRTHSNSIADDIDDDKGSSGTKVAGRATRNAGRAGCVADSLLACELCELIDESTSLFNKESSSDNEHCDLTADELYGVNGTLYQRKVIYNESHLDVKDDMLKTLSVLVLYEPDYVGGAGLDHGGIDNLLGQNKGSSSSKSSTRGRIIIIVSDRLANDLSKTLTYLDASSYQLGLSSGLVANEVVSVHKGLYRAAGKILNLIHPILIQTANDTSANHTNNSSKIEDNTNEAMDNDSSATILFNIKDNANEPAIHIVGRSLAGGIASLMAAILDGTLPMPETNRRQKLSKRKRREKREKVSVDSRNSSNGSNHNTTVLQISGCAQGRTSAIALGPPPCLSSNVKASYITSVIHGDDVVSRTTQESLDRLLERTKKVMKGGFIGQKVGWMADTVSLTFSSMKSHAYGSEGEELKLAIPGKTYLIRPRRLGGASSLHEVGDVSGREAIRAAVLWQLGDVLLSKSFWAHHSLEGYINGLDRVQLREFRSVNDENDINTYL